MRAKWVENQFWSPPSSSVRVMTATNFNLHCGYSIFLTEDIIPKLYRRQSNILLLLSPPKENIQIIPTKFSTPTTSYIVFHVLWNKAQYNKEIELKQNLTTLFALVHILNNVLSHSMNLFPIRVTKSRKFKDL